MYDYLYHQEGQEELIQILKFLSDATTSTIDTLKVIHADQSVESALARANKLQGVVGMQMLNTKWAKKEDRLEEVAKMHLSCGNIKQFCEI